MDLHSEGKKETSNRRRTRWS